MNTDGNETFGTRCPGGEPADLAHVVAYSGPACAECGRPTLIAQVSAPGYGLIRVCEAGHDEELSPCGIVTLEDVI